MSNIFLIMKFVNSHTRAVVGVVAWWLELILPVQSVYITTNVVSSNPANGEVYSIQHYVIKFVSDLRQLVVFSSYSYFLSSIKMSATI